MKENDNKYKLAQFENIPSKLKVFDKIKNN